MYSKRVITSLQRANRALLLFTATTKCFTRSVASPSSSGLFSSKYANKHNLKCNFKYFLWNPTVGWTWKQWSYSHASSWRPLLKLLDRNCLTNSKNTRLWKHYGGKYDSLVTHYWKINRLKGDVFEQFQISKMLEQHFCVSSREEQICVVYWLGWVSDTSSLAAADAVLGQRRWRLPCLFQEAVCPAVGAALPADIRAGGFLPIPSLCPGGWRRY